MIDYEQYARQYADDSKLTWAELAKIINAENGTDYTREEVRNRLKRKVKKYQPQELPQERPTLVFGDVHLPFEHKHFLKFLKDVDHKYKCKQQKVCTGDIVDNHAVSRFVAAHDNMGAKAEYNTTLLKIREYTETFPDVKFCMGNHDNIPSRQAQTIGLYDGFLKDFDDAWCIPKTWDIQTKHMIDNVLYKHGINCGGITGARATAIKEGVSTVIGHIHSHGGVSYAANTHSMLFGANAGCGIDVDAYAFEYGKESKDKPTLGCVLVYNPNHAVFIPMPIDYYNSL